MTIVPSCLENQKSTHFINLDGFSYSMYKPEKGQDRTSMTLPKNLFSYIIKGEKIIHYKEKDIAIQSGEAFFARKGEYLLSDRFNMNGEYESLIFIIEDQLILRFLERYPSLSCTSQKEEFHGIFKLERSRLLETHIDSILPYFTNSFSNKPEVLQLKLEEILLHILNSEGGDHFRSFLQLILNPQKKDLLNFMNNNFTQPLSLSGFAEKSHRSLSSFKKEFKEIFEIPPRQWIQSKRLERAHELLLSQKCNVTEICYDSGFENLSYFIRLFKEKYGITPKQLLNKK